MCSSQSEDYDMQKKKKKVIIRNLTPMFMVVFDFVLKSHFYTGGRGILWAVE